jgi:hypothetical protein
MVGEYRLLEIAMHVLKTWVCDARDLVSVP